MPLFGFALLGMLLAQSAADGLGSQAAPSASASQTEQPTLAGSRAITWINKPNAMDMAYAAPEATTMHGLSGRIVLMCQAAANGRLAGCRIESEEPMGKGFGAAALSVARKFQMAPTAADGTSVAGGTVRIPIMFTDH